MALGLPEKDREEMQSLEKKFHIHKLEDWYDVPKTHIRLYGDAYNLWNTYPSVETLVSAFYPAHAWDHAKFKKHSTKTLSAEIFMRRILLTLFPNYKMEFNSRTHGIIGENNIPLEIDVYIPTLRIGFEYQDPHHYFHIRTYGTSTLAEYQKRDIVKMKVSHEKGITIINIPFWWDWNTSSLIATIKHKRPDLLKTTKVEKNVPLITEDPPQHVKEEWDFQIPGLGMPMLALEAPRKQSFSPANWLIFEKFDGIRAIWNAEERVLYSRWGKELEIPHFISETFSQYDWLDGEIWFGRERGMRYEAINVSKAAHHLVNWDKFKYVVFDCVSPEMREEPYVDRYKKLEGIFPSGKGSYLTLAPYDVCTGKEFAEVLFFALRSRGGEGIILRDPNSAYVNGYSRHLYKYKGFTDAEALVLKKISDTTFLCRVNKMQMRHNTREDKENEGEEEEKDEDTFYDVEMTIDTNLFYEDVGAITEGSFVSFKYVGEYAKGLGRPMNPRIYTIRHDIQNWEQVLGSKRKPPSENPIWKPASVHNWTDKESRRKFFDDIAKQHKFDPLNPENWYILDSKEILKEGRGLLVRHYQGSHLKALMDVYPELEWNETNFQRVPKHHWENKENILQFFNEMAKERGFDPLIAENWYPFAREDVLRRKGGVGILKKYNHSFTNVLIDVYPFVKFDKNKFFSQLPISDPVKQKAFFTQFAQKNSFDPLIPSNWYWVHADDIAEERGGKALLKLYMDSVPQALKSAFPKVKFDSLKFTKIRRKPPNTISKA
eukprot:Phypoly_transcript_02926.p1 GENE.Phypoly_transcript_02926~~Phypoly_transcript_02926.p1  ORF type:complete len:773 (+),score=149.17 Phypoly_transcript_02926:98-2416(+)